MTQYAVGIEACRIKTREQAEEIANLIRDRMKDIDEHVTVSISEYEHVPSQMEEFENLLQVKGDYTERKMSDDNGLS